ncbi:ABC transporter substrate-binding protein [Vulcanococcus limneticus Candia 3F8]|nr:ABC transporter substrate-binding protein [Vulcanococcus limneticus]MCP9793486.1 ABC transporter substrate-binding protein [Vulcanococcus limneticus MW73D5]MCP9895450.1 ABC transporter substrate-binding protein [Vulcanococcus limneticus Candia 3F8]MCP9898865.1 ABC transporter substrate-binding protein [Vulcanococcus limneticus Candia 3B3]
MLSLLAGGCALLPWLGRTIEMPLAPWPGYEYFYLAEKKRLAEAIGLKMQTRQFADPQAIVYAYLRGDLQVAQLTTVEVVDLCARLPHRCPVVVLVLDESRGADMVAARPEYQTIEQLSGARVAVTPSTHGPYVLSRALEREGLSLADVTVVPMPLGRMAGALQRREVEAAAFFPPFSDYSLRVGLARRLFDSSRIPGEIFDVLAVDPHIATHHRKELVLLLRTWQAAHDLAAREPDMADRLMADREKLSVQRFREAQSGLLYPSLREQVPLLQVGGVLERNLRAVQRVQQTLGLLKPGAPVPRVDDRPLLEALRSAAP